MTSQYTPKTSYLSPNRLEKIAKDLLKETGQDRELALEAYRYYKDILKEDPQDISARNLMVDCLKVAQTSKNNALKLLQLATKIHEANVAKKSTKIEKDNLGLDEAFLSELD